MTNPIQVHGRCPAEFSAVEQHFQSLLEAEPARGMAFAVCRQGEVLISLWGGAKDEEGAPWQEDSLVNVFSTGKAAVALMMAKLVDDGDVAYDMAVSEVWPEFSGEGKERVTLAQLLSHQAGLPGLRTAVAPDTWYDQATIAGLLAEETPWWEPGTAHGYHPVTFGHLAQEVSLRATGQTLGQHLKRHVGDAGMDVHLGLPAALEERCAVLKKPSRAPDLGELTRVKRAAFVDNPTPGGRQTASSQWRRAELPAINVHASALGLARLSSVMTGKSDTAFLTRSVMTSLMTGRVSGPDLVLPMDLTWAAGLMVNDKTGVFGPNPGAVGHPGFGGSFVMADPESGLSAGFVVGTMSHYLAGDPRGLQLLNSVYEALA